MGCNTVVSLFSGAGGLSKGFALAGVKPIAGVELDRDARASYEKNLLVPCHGVDLGEVTPAVLRKTLGVTDEPFAIIGGPPCQGFSSAGMRAEDDPRNRLIFNYLHIVAELKPRWFLFENVEGLLTAAGGQSIYQLARQFLGLGYWIRIEKINFAGFGVPQSRKRVLIIGNRLGFEFQFPRETHAYDAGKHWSRAALSNAPTLFQALGGLGTPAESMTAEVKYATGAPVNAYDAIMRAGNAFDTVTLHFAPHMSSQDAERAAALKPGQTMKDLPEHLWHHSFRRRAFRRVMDGTPTERRGGAPSGLKRLHPNLNCLTITGAATTEFIHPQEDRPLTIRECARIQSFDDGYRFVGNARSVIQQIGNAVPPMGAHVLAKELVSCDGRLGSGKVVPIRRGGPALLGFNLTAASGMSPALAQTYSLLESLMDDLGINDEVEEVIAARQAT